MAAKATRVVGDDAAVLAAADEVKKAQQALLAYERDLRRRDAEREEVFRAVQVAQRALSDAKALLVAVALRTEDV